MVVKCSYCFFKFKYSVVYLWKIKNASRNTIWYALDFLSLWINKYWCCYSVADAPWER